MIRIQTARTKELHQLFAQIGHTCKNSVTRLGYSDLESSAHTTFANCISQIPGWIKSVDIFGNTHFTLRGTDPDLPPIRMGSHLDSVQMAGLYDGTSGCIAALQIAEYMYNNGIKLKRTLVISLWRCEESTRFGAAMLGSRLFCGLLPYSALNEITETVGGISILGAMISQGLDAKIIKREMRSWKIPPTGCYHESHIEQGPELHAGGLDVGIVTGFCGTWRCEIVFKGRKDHSSRKNGLRNDAMQAAMFAGAEIYGLVDPSKEYPVVTIGGLNSDGSMNCIAGKVSFTIDVRGPKGKKLEKLGKEIKQIVAKHAGMFEVEVAIKEKGYVKPVCTSTKLQKQLIALADDEEYSYDCIYSGAGHDAMSFALAGIPCIMYFAPSWTRKAMGAYSHSPDEYASYAKLARTTAYMTHCILAY